VFFGLQLFLVDNAHFDAIAEEFLDLDRAAAAAAAAAAVVVVSMIDYCHGSSHGYGTSM